MRSFIARTLLAAAVSIAVIGSPAAALPDPINAVSTTAGIASANATNVTSEAVTLVSTVGEITCEIHYAAAAAQPARWVDPSYRQDPRDIANAFSTCSDADPLGVVQEYTAYLEIVLETAGRVPVQLDSHVCGNGSALGQVHVSCQWAYVHDDIDEPLQYELRQVRFTAGYYNPSTSDRVEVVERVIGPVPAVFNVFPNDPERTAIDFVWADQPPGCRPSCPASNGSEDPPPDI